MLWNFVVFLQGADLEREFFMFCLTILRSILKINTVLNSFVTLIFFFNRFKKETKTIYKIPQKTLKVFKTILSKGLVKFKLKLQNDKVLGGINSDGHEHRSMNIKLEVLLTAISVDLTLKTINHFVGNKFGQIKNDRKGTNNDC